MRRILTAAGLAAGMAIAPALASEEQFIGEVFAAPALFCPEGSLIADGRVLKTRDHQALASIIGNRYGGDGKSTFALPKLTDRAFGGKNAKTFWCIVAEGIYPLKPEHQP